VGLIIIPAAKNGNMANSIVISRLEAWQRLLNYDKRLILWDVFITLLIGTIYTMIVIEPINLRQAFLSSLTAESFVFHFIISARQVNGNN
jgi:hypothetical protein